MRRCLRRITAEGVAVAGSGRPRNLAR